jgi:DNA-binding NarL/FixJ family response regulator
MKRTRILLAFHRASSLAAFRRLLEEEYEIVGTAADYRSLLAKGLKSEPDAILGDVALSLWSQPDLKHTLKQLIPKTRVLLVSIDNDTSTEHGSQQTWASGLAVRRTSGEKLMEVFHEFLEEQDSKITEPPSNANYSFEQGHDAARELTQRQREVLKLLAEGRTMKQTGEILNLTTRTIAFHKYKIMRDFELHNNLELLKLAIRKHLVSAD